MATRRTGLEEELMTDANIAKVIRLLNPEEEGVKAITKKEACSILGMAYNTKRLDQVIEQYLHRKELERKRRAEKRGKAATPDEISYAISEYIAGEPISAIAKALYRSPQFVKNILESKGVPIRNAAHDYFHPVILPEQGIRERFKVGEIVYSSRYDSTCRIDGEVKNDPKHGWIYRVWLLSPRWQQFAYQEAAELASLDHLRELGVRV